MRAPPALTPCKFSKKMAIAMRIASVKYRACKDIDGDAEQL